MTQIDVGRKGYNWCVNIDILHCHYCIVRGFFPLQSPQFFPESIHEYIVKNVSVLNI